ncbi:MAG: hypothetical protein QXP08_06805, partial [Sulfolobales archaeon]
MNYDTYKAPHRVFGNELRRYGLERITQVGQRLRKSLLKNGSRKAFLWGLSIRTSKSSYGSAKRIDDLHS